MACAQDMKELIETSTSGEIAAFMAEPIMGVGGYITPPKEYFKEAVAIIRQYGGVFICDEVQTGWGRTGDKWFGIEHWDVEPDIITSAKGMANGSPIGWTIATPGGRGRVSGTDVLDLRRQSGHDARGAGDDRSDRRGEPGPQRAKSSATICAKS